MSKQPPSNQLAGQQPFDSPSNQYLLSRPHPNRGLLGPKLQRMSRSWDPLHQQIGDARHHRDRDDDRRTSEYERESNARQARRRQSRRANGAKLAPARRKEPIEVKRVESFFESSLWHACLLCHFPWDSATH